MKSFKEFCNENYNNTFTKIDKEMRSPTNDATRVLTSFDDINLHYVTNDKIEAYVVTDKSNNIYYYNFDNYEIGTDEDRYVLDTDEVAEMDSIIAVFDKDKIAKENINKFIKYINSKL